MSDLARALLEDLAGDPVALVRLRELIGESGPERWVGVREAAEHIGAKPQRIYDLVHQRAIPHRKDGSRLLFRLSELDDWLDCADTLDTAKSWPGGARTPPAVTQGGVSSHEYPEP